MIKNQIPSVAQGFAELPDGSTVEVGTPQWVQWLTETQSFRYCPTGSNSPFTARKEQSTKGKGDYWYGYRKAQGKLSKAYMGRGEDLTQAKLEETASKLDAALRSSQTDQKPLKAESPQQNEIPRLQAEITRLQNQLEAKQQELELALGKMSA